MCSTKWRPESAEQAPLPRAHLGAYPKELMARLHPVAPQAGEPRPAPLRVTVIGPRGLANVIGGVERHCALLYPALADAAPEMAFRLFIRNGEEASLHPQLALISIAGPRRATFDTVIYSARALLRSAWSSDIVHFHGIGPAFFAPLARACGAKVVMTHHAVDYQRPKWGRLARGFLKLGERLGGHFSHRVICVSDALRRDFLLRVPSARSRTTTILHGAEILPGTPKEDRATLSDLGLVPGGYLLAVGRIEGTKRLVDLIIAHGQAGKAALPLVIVGESIGDTRHERELRLLAEGGRVIFTGARRGAELGALYRQAAAFFHASAMEGFGLVVLEALLAGPPTFLSDIPVHREFGLPDGHYFNVGDRAALARLMREVRHRSEAWSVGEAAGARYSLADEVMAHRAIYRALAPAAVAEANTASNSAQ